MQESQDKKNEVIPQTMTQITAFLNILPDALIAIDRIGNIVMSNTQADELFGYTHNEMIQIHVDMLLPERFRAAHGRHRAHYFLAPQARLMGTGLKLYGLRKDGSEFPVDISLRPVIVEDNGMAAVAVIKDITNMSSLAERVESLTRLIQERTIAPVIELTHRVGNMEQRMDIYEAKMSDMQIKLTEVSDATKENKIVLDDIQQSVSPLIDMAHGILFIKRVSLGILGVIGVGISTAVGTLIINYFTHK